MLWQRSKHQPACAHVLYSFAGFSSADEVVTEGQTQDAAKRLGSAKLALNAVGGKSAADLSKVLVSARAGPCRDPKAVRCVLRTPTIPCLCRPRVASS